MAQIKGKLLTANERNACQKIASSRTGINSKRATALLTLDDGIVQKEAAEKSGLTLGQVRYALTLFRKKKLSMFPAVSEPSSPKTDNVSTDPEEQAPAKTIVKVVEEAAEEILQVTEDTKQPKKKKKEKAAKKPSKKKDSVNKKKANKAVKNSKKKKPRKTKKDEKKKLKSTKKPSKKNSDKKKKPNKAVKNSKKKGASKAKKKKK